MRYDDWLDGGRPIEPTQHTFEDTYPDDGAELFVDIEGSGFGSSTLQRYASITLEGFEFEVDLQTCGVFLEKGDAGWFDESSMTVIVEES